MTERLDPEEVKDIMSRIFGDIAQIITKYEGSGQVISIVNDIAGGLTDPDLKMKYFQSGTIQELSNQAKLN